MIAEGCPRAGFGHRLAERSSATMSRCDEERLADILIAINAIKGNLLRGALGDGLVHGGVRLRLIEIGEAVKGIHARRC